MDTRKRKTADMSIMKGGLEGWEGGGGDGGLNDKKLLHVNKTVYFADYKKYNMQP